MASEKAELEVFLSTDGKHTIHIKCPAEMGDKDRKEAVAGAINMYRFIAKELGTKPELWGDAMNGKKKKQEVQEPPRVETRYCSIHKAVMHKAISKKTGKPYFFHKNEQGQICFGGGYQ